MPTPSGTPIGANSPITWAQLGAIFAIVLTIIGPLTAALYTGIRNGQKETNDRLKSLEDRFQSAIVASANVKQLLETAPTLQHDITETNKTVFELKGSMEALKTVPQQIQMLQQDFGKLQIQTNNIQKQ